MAIPSTGAKDFGTSTADKMKEAGSRLGDKAKETGTHIADKAKEAGTQIADKAKEIGSNLADKAKSAASSFTDKTKEAASNAGETLSNTAEKWTSSAGTGARHLGDALEQRGPHDGMLGDATRAVAGGLRQGGRYLEEEGFSGMIEDVTEVVRRNPLPAILVGLGIGFLIGRTLGS